MLLSTSIKNKYRINSIMIAIILFVIIALLPLSEDYVYISTFIITPFLFLYYLFSTPNILKFDKQYTILIILFLCAIASYIYIENIDDYLQEIRFFGIAIMLS